MIWSKRKATRLYERPLLDLLYRAQRAHRHYFKNNEMELCSLLSIKTGACPEDCAYCPQSAHYQTNLKREKLIDITQVLEKANEAKQNGATRFCMGAAWRGIPNKKLPLVVEMIKGVKALGLETCVTLGMLDEKQAQTLKEAGLDFYNHNLDTSPQYYKKIITTRQYEDRLDTLSHVRKAGLHVCCGGIIGMGESKEDRIELLLQLANLKEPPESVPINYLNPIPGTPLENVPDLAHTEFIRTIALARVMMPRSVIRLSAGRTRLSEEMQILCFMAGANSIWLGEKLLTTQNCDQDQDKRMLQRLGMNIKKEKKACLNA